MFDKLAATKERQRAEEKALATDYEGSMMRVLTAQAAGQQPDPADLMRAQAFDRFNMAQNAVNPATGDPFPKNSSILGNLQNAGGAAYPQGGLYGPPSMQASPMPPSIPNGTYNNDLGNINDAVPPLGDNYMDVATMSPDQRTQQRMAPTVDLPAPSNTKQAGEVFKTKLDIAKDAALEERKNEISSRSKTEGKAQFDNALASVMIDLNKLNRIGGITNNKRPVSENIQSYAASTTVGQELGKAGGTEAQTLRDNIKNKKLTLTKAIMQATGMTSKQMDSNAELKTFLDSLGSPTATYQSNMDTLKYLSDMYGGGAANKPEMPENNEYKTTPSGVKYRVVQ